MPSHQLPRKLPFLPISRLLRHFPRLPRRFQSSSITTDTKTRTRATRILDRVPRSLRPYTVRLRSAPISHIISFLILHELTAVVPLVGLAAGFHWAGWMPALVTDSEWIAPAVGPAVEKFGRYFRRKGWFGLAEEEKGEEENGLGGGATVASSRSSQSASMKHKEEQAQGQVQDQAQTWNLNSPGARVVVEVAAAYAITKALLPLRLMLSVWATPWFARAVVGRVLALGRPAAGGAGTAVAAGGIERSATAASTTEATKSAAKGVGKDIPKA